MLPDVVRELHRQWQIGLIQGELERGKPVLPVGEVLTQQERHVGERELHELLASLPTPKRAAAGEDRVAHSYSNGGTHRAGLPPGGNTEGVAGVNCWRS